MKVGQFLKAAVLVLLTTATDQLCPVTPIPTREISYINNTWCFAEFNKTGFCNAVKTCHDNNMEIPGSYPVFMALKNAGLLNGTAMSTGKWIGLTDASNERGRKRDGWVWIKDGLLTGANDNIFGILEPNSYFNEDCVVALNSKLNDCRCTDEFRFYCYSNHDGSPVLSERSPSSAQFAKTPIVADVQPDAGCSLDVSSSKITNQMLCSASCYEFGADCVGFYWNSGRQKCIVLMYFDATVQLQYNSPYELMQWEKFVRNPY